MNQSAGTSIDADSYATRRLRFAVATGLLLVAVAWAALSLGAVTVPAGQVLGVLAGKIGITAFDTATAQAEAVVWGIRMPRLLLGITVGSTLAMVGGVLQGLLRNDLADPQLLGIGPGAGIGAVVGAAAGGIAWGIAGGVATGVITSLVIRNLAKRGSVDPTRLILSGVALGATLSAMVGFVVFSANRARVPPIEFWLLGSLSGATWRSFGTVLLYVTVPLGVMLASSRTLDILSLGETDARHIGMNVDLIQTILLTTCGAAVGATVGAAGVIAFVGLLVPFIVRKATGPQHRYLLFGAMAGGALFLCLSDLFARLVIQPIEVPVGLVTAVVGGPIFLWLLSRKHDV